MMEYKSNQHRQMAKVKNILSQIFFPKRLESSSHESYSGSCGDHAQWSLNPENGELRITGTGPLYDFFGEKEVPWESHLNHIRKVVVAHGITYIGFQAFSYCKSLSSVQLPDTLTGIGQHAFNACHALEQITIPPSVHHLGKHIFSGCRSLKTLTVPFPACGTPATFSNFGELFGTTPDIEMRKISQDNETGKETNYYLPHSLSVLRILEGCEIIPSKCLMNCFVLKELHLPSSLYMMGEKAVYGCAGLKTIYCQAAEPASIHADTFGGIRFNVCRIHVPQGSTEKYKQDQHWKYFSQIEDYGTILQAMNRS
jgi:cell surface protein